MYASVVVIFHVTAMSIGHGFVLVVLIILPGITEPEAKVRNRIIRFCTLQAPYRFLEAVLLYAEIEAPTVQLLRRYSQQRLQPVRGVHDCQGPGETVQEQCSSRLMSVWFRALGEFRGNVGQHVVSRISWRRGEELSDDWCVHCTLCQTLVNRTRDAMVLCCSAYSGF